ncbi:MAG: O-antigen ligase family protein [Candidatus Omnitrophota bacterium]|jgi:O-antigen ligase
MKINLNLLKLFLVFCVGLFLPWGRNSLPIGIYPPLLFVVATFCLAAYLPFTGIKIPSSFKLFLLFIIAHIVITIIILGQNYLFLIHTEAQSLGSELLYVRRAPVITSIGQIIFLIIFFVVMMSVLKNKKEWLLFISSFLCGLVLVCSFKLVFYGFSEARFTGGYNDANTFGITACIAFFLAFVMKEGVRNRLLKVVSLAFSVFFFFMILLSQSRGAFVALLIGGCVLLKEKNLRLYKIIAVLIALSLFAVIVRPFFPERFSMLNSWLEDRGSLRLDVWLIYLSHFWDFFFTGVGYMRSADVISTGILRKELVTHNFFLQMLVEFGIGGLLLFLFTLKQIWSSLSRVPGHILFTPGIKAAFLSWLIGACFLSSFAERETWFIFALAASFIALTKKNPYCVKPEAGQAR